MRITRSVATLSWIDPKTGLPEVDDAGAPGAMIPRAFIIGKSGCRFSNFLEAWIEVDDTAGNAIIGGNFTSASGMYRGPSFLGTESAPVGNIGRKIIRTPGSVTFRQLVGCRTMAPEKIGRTAGAVVGYLAGSAIPVAGQLIGGYAGFRIGRATAEAVKVFPPIWTELELTISSDGGYAAKLLRHSLFPSVSYYVPHPVDGLAQAGLYLCAWVYDAVPMLDAWYEGGWNGAAAASTAGSFVAAPTPGNPWSMTKPTFTTDSIVVSSPQGY